MRKFLLLISAVLLIGAFAVAQGNEAKQDINEAGKNVKKATKATGRATKNAAIAAKNKTTGTTENEVDKNETAHQEAMENSVHIVQGPMAQPARDHVTINWVTNKTAANDVWLTGGGIRGHRVFYSREGSTNHTAMFGNLKPNTTYNFEIRTREGGDRKNGTFRTLP